jgi:hypothetical protein
MNIDAELLECFHRIALALECINRHLYQMKHGDNTAPIHNLDTSGKQPGVT